MGWVVYFIAFISVVAVGSKLYVKEESNSNKGKALNGFIAIAVLMVATLGAMWITAELGFTLGGYSTSGDEYFTRPGVGPHEW